MKKPYAGIVALLAGAFTAYSQGNVVFTDYASGNYTYVKLNGHPVGGTAPNTGTAADIADGADWTVQLYGSVNWNDSLSSLQPVILYGSVTSQNPNGQPVTATLASIGPGQYLGTWFSTEVGDIPGTTFANEHTTVAVAAWYNAGGLITSIQAAQAAGLANGWSATANIITGGLYPGGLGPPIPPTQLPALGNINVVGIVPEPDTLALGLMGTTTILFAFRKK